MELFDAIKKRRVTREFSDKEVDFSCIESMIEAAAYAPTCNHMK